MFLHFNDDVLFIFVFIFLFFFVKGIRDGLFTVCVYDIRLHIYTRY